MPQMSYPSQVASHIETLRCTFYSGKTKPLSFRRQQLKNLLKLLTQHEKAFADALYADLHKPHFEAYSAEIGFVKAEIRHTLKHLSEWAETKKLSAPLAHQPAHSIVHKEPLGVVLIIGPWNYPLQLILAPLVSALAAGNCALLKPSELAPTLSNTIAKLLPQYIQPEVAFVAEGGADTTSALLQHRFDYIFFTGSMRVGQIIMKAAAKYVTPLTLELGGKSPCIVDADVDVELTAKRIAWGKLMNAGQTCIAPDYLLVHEKIEQPLIQALERTITAFYTQEPHKSPDYGRIINKGHFERLCGYLKEGRILYGGHTQEEELYISPTLIAPSSMNISMMTEEIFGPILPIISVKNMGEAIDFVQRKPLPLACYLFSNSKRHQSEVTQRIQCGGLCINDTISHIAMMQLPFGGVGESGFGAYRGKQGFDTFSHSKSIFIKGTLFDIPLRYPPFSNMKLKIAKWFI